MKRTLIVIFLLIFCGALITAGFLLDRPQKDPDIISITLNGTETVYVEYGSTYEEPGATATLNHEGTVTAIPVEISGTVNPEKVGQYQVTYTARSGECSKKIIRQVHVVDTVCPVITLLENPDILTLPNRPYQEEGFTATDNYDGDLTAKVSFSEKDGIVTYTVSDSSGNTATAERTVTYFYPTAPQLSLNGGEVIVVPMGSKYHEPGCTVTDDYDKDLSGSVTVDCRVDVNTPGIYYQTYSVANRYEVSASAVRTVYVFDPELMPTNIKGTHLPTGGIAIRRTGEVIHLTFDDGPGPYTAHLLDILKKYDAKVSFFIVMSAYIDVISRAAEEGHTLAMHSYTHEYRDIYSSEEAFIADLQAIQKGVLKYSGVDTKLMRFVGGSSNTISKAYNKGIMTRLVKKLTEMGYTYFDWNVDSRDAGVAMTPDEVFNNVTKSIVYYKKSVVLQHDIQKHSVDAVERILVWGICNGYTFEALTEDSPTCHHPVMN